MAPLEPLLAKFCRYLNMMVKSINQNNFLALAHNIIEETPTSKVIKEYPQRICGIEKSEKKLGKKYFTVLCNGIKSLFTQQKHTNNASIV
jgi:hypothetical protein